MHTEDDLRSAFAALEDNSPTAEDVLAALHRPPRRPRAGRPLALAAAATAVVAVTLTVPAVVHQRSQPTGVTSGAPGQRTGPLPDPCAPAGTATAFRFFQIDAVAGVRLDMSRTVCPGQRTTLMHSPAGALLGQVEVYGQGAFDPTEVRRGRPVQVDGHAGYFGVLKNPPVKPGGRTLPASSTSALAWPYAADAWVVVRAAASRQATGPSFLPLALRVAHALHPEVSRPMLLPFRLGYLPDGLAPATANSGLIMPGGGIVFADRRQRAAVQVTVVGDADLNMGVRDGAERVHVNGHDGLLFRRGLPGPLKTGPRLDLAAGPWLVSLRVPQPGGSVTAEQLLDIARGMTLAASPADQATWFDATTSTP